MAKSVARMAASTVRRRRTIAFTPPFTFGRTRNRNVADPCGSAVISHLQWDTSGGQSERELGIFHDFIVKFTMEVKRFPTQWPPHAHECVAKQ